jgi:hypothetical protein
MPASRLLLFALLLGVALLIKPAFRRLILRLQLKPLMNAVDRLRAVAEHAPRYDRVQDGDPRLEPFAVHFNAMTAQFEALGFRSLGDACEVSHDERQVGVVRWVASGDGAACGWFGVVQSAKAPKTPVMVLFSEAKGRGFAITRRGGPDLALTRAPTIVHTLVGKEAPLSEMAETHTKAAQGVAAGSALTAVRSLEEAVALALRFREENLAWRTRQPADWLLKQDLRRVLEHAATIMEPEKFRKLFDRAAEWAGGQK